MRFVLIFFQIFYCFGSWLELGSFPPNVIANSQLLRSVFETLVRRIQILIPLTYLLPLFRDVCADVYDS